MQEIEGYIRDHRQRYTREAIVAELEAAGHPRHEIDAAWDRMAGGEPLAGDASPLGRYAWIVYWIGAGLIVLYIAFFVVGGAPGFIGLGAGWLLAYLALAYWPVRALARSRPSGLAGSLGVVVAAPLLVLLIGGGLCVGTIALIASSFGG